MGQSSRRGPHGAKLAPGGFYWAKLAPRASWGKARAGGLLRPSRAADMEAPLREQGGRRLPLPETRRLDTNGAGSPARYSPESVIAFSITPMCE
jgi:hypothetical protein